MKIITVAMGKGGTGKSTTAFSIACNLSQMGYKTLVWDNDAQGTLTKALLDNNYTHTSYDAIMSTQKVEDVAVRAIDSFSENLFVVPADRKLGEIDSITSSRYDRALLFADVVAQGLSKFDYLIVDTPPNINSILTVAPIVGSHFVLPVCSLAPTAFEQVAHFQKVVEHIKARMNPALEILPVLGTLKHNQNLDKEIEEELRARYMMFKTVISKRIRIAEEMSQQISSSSPEYKDLTIKELLPRIGK